MRRLCWYFFSLIWIVGCGSGSHQQKNGERRISVVCTTSIIADTVQAIAGDFVEVQALMGPGIDPHLYRACAGDVQKLSHADIIFYNGLHLEGKMADLLGSLQQASAITSSLNKNQLLTSGFVDVYDPHIWHDVALWSQAVEVVRDTLSARDPHHKDYYYSRATEYTQQLQQLDAWVRQQLATIPVQQRILITAHDAFRYFGRAYGVSVIGLQGVSTESDVGIKEIQSLAQMITDKKIPAIFVESSVPKRSIEALRNAVVSRGFAVRLGDSLLSDALGTGETDDDTYIGMIRHNVNAIVTALSAE